jgi:beta-galactosidase/beta-glucuronidase
VELLLSCFIPLEMKKFCFRHVYATIAMVLVVTGISWKRVCAQSLSTRWAESVTAENVWQEYPRPQFRRNAWVNLNGLWDYSLQGKADPMPRKFQGKILVPFCIESALSGVGKTMMQDDRLWYRREFAVPADWKGKKVILNFEAVDYVAAVWLNGSLVGSHKGAYDRFSFDITPFLRTKGRQEIVVCVDDPSSYGSQPRGKQQMPQQGIWYTPVSGIWQTVWIEAVSPEAWLKEARIIPDIDHETVSVIPMTDRPLKHEYNVVVTVFESGREVARATVPADKKVDIKVENPKLWSPDSPFLYDMKMVLTNKNGEELDMIESYFGMRKISLGEVNGNKHLFLNNKPLFHYGTLDQGWWPDGLHTPPSDEAMRYDLEITKSMGFNMIRKHTKIEPDRWYYHCDQLGLMVWQDMPSGMAVLPEEGKERPTALQHVARTGEDLFRRSESAAQFEWELKRMIDLHFNAPSIVVWVPFNEGWGQYATCRITDMVKAYDITRLVNATSGWALRSCGDIYSIHSYQVDVTVPPISIDRASVLGEYGGIGYPVEGHLWNPKMRNWGYQTYHSADELLQHYKYKFGQVLEMKRSKGLSAAVYTQTTDVEGEVNGLMTYDRKLIKLPIEVLKALHEELFK